MIFSIFPRYFLILFLVAATSNAGIIGSSGRFSIFKRNNINKYYSCNGNQISFINQAYKDTLKLADNVRPFLPVRDELFAPGQPAGELEKRYFGADIAPEFAPKPNLIRTVINNIANWYPWPIFDWIFGKRIEVSCVDLPNKSGLTCGTKKGDEGQRIGAYALSENGPQIVFCPLFFLHLKLDQVEQNLRQTPAAQKDLTQMKSAAHIFFHEMTHLAVISETSSVVIKDLLADPETPMGKPVYGPRLCEKLAARFPSFAANNADNYAWYATAKYFETKFGTPDVPKKSSASDNNEPPDSGPFLNIFDATDEDAQNIPDELSGYDPDGAEIKDVLDTAKGFKNFPGNLTVHPDGLLLPTGTGDEGQPPSAQPCVVPQGCTNSAAASGGCAISCG